MIKKDGWVSIHRKIFDNDLWKIKPFSPGQAWIDLILMANHKNNQINFGTTILECERGAVVTSQLKLADRWGWSRQQVRTFLINQQITHQITNNSTNKLTKINITNYDTYQRGQPTDQPANHPQNNQQITTNNNINKLNKLNKKNIFPEVQALYDLFLSTLSEKERSVYEPKDENLKSEWLDCLDKCQRIEGFDYWQIADIICEFRNDNFWKNNFKSPLKLREKDKTAKVHRIIVWWDKYESDVRNAGEIIEGPTEGEDLEYIKQLTLEQQDEKESRPVPK